jgi:hypothetical protein
MSVYNPEGFAFLKIADPSEPEGFIYKVIGSWSGGYLYGESWRMNSGIESVEDKNTHLHVHGHSGSIYVVRKGGQGLSSYAMCILAPLLGQEDTKATIITTEEILTIFKDK